MPRTEETRYPRSTLRILMASAARSCPEVMPLQKVSTTVSKEGSTMVFSFPNAPAPTQKRMSAAGSIQLSREDPRAVNNLLFDVFVLFVSPFELFR
jgi:hypothetical protein